MEPASTICGIIYFANRQPKSLAEWNAQYEAFSFHQDWWFKAGAALVGWVRSAIASISRAIAAGQTPTNSALRAARA